jgi:hypothetical protein
MAQFLPLTALLRQQMRRQRMFREPTRGYANADVPAAGDQYARQRNDRARMMKENREP